MALMTQVELASKRLYGPGGLAATNVKIFRGSNRDVTAEQIAEQINRSLSQLEAGNFELATIDEDD